MANNNKYIQKQQAGFPLPPEPTIWALRKRGLLENEGQTPITPSLYEHLFGYNPIRLQKPADTEAIRKGSAENPALNIIDPKTNFTLVEIASDLPPEE